MAIHRGVAAPGASATRVNSPAFKFNLALCPSVTRSTPAFDTTMKFEGQVILWLDKQVDLLTFTDRGIELADKWVADAGLAQLLTSEKVTFDQVSKKLTYESLLTTGSGGLLNPLSLGLVADSSDPRPAFRFKCTSPKLAGSFRVAAHVKAELGDPDARVLVVSKCRVSECVRRRRCGKHPLLYRAPAGLA